MPRTGGSFGGGGGFSGGGGSHGGGGRGFGGPMFFGWGRPYYGGGCLGGLLGIIFGPVIAIILLLAVMINLLFGGFQSMLKGGEATYDEQVFDDYAMEQYYEVFESSEDAVLLVCVLDKEYTTYYCNTVFGDHLSSSFAKMFKDEYSAFPSIVRNNIQETGYKYSLGQDLGDAVEDFTLYLKGKDIGPLLSCGGSDSPSAEPGLLNKSSLHVVTGGVDEALKTFQEETGITLVIVVDDFENVFPKQMDIGTILAVLFCLVLLVLCIVSLVKSIRRRKGGGGDNPNTTKNSNPPSGGNTYDGDYTSW